MIYKESSIDIIRDVVEAMVFPIVIETVVTAPVTIHTLTVDNIQHSQPGYSVTIAGKTFVIQSIASPDTIVVKGTDIPVPGTFNLYKPFFFHGTPIETNTSLVQIKNAKSVTPMVWFLENFNDKFFDDIEEAKEREITLRLFFLAEADHAKWKVGTAYTNAIEPMRRLAENFVEQLRKTPSRFFLEGWEFDLINYAKFGVEITNKGMEKSMFAQDLAGCELNTTLPILKLDPCA